MAALAAMSWTHHVMLGVPWSTVDTLDERNAQQPARTWPCPRGTIENSRISPRNRRHADQGTIGGPNPTVCQLGK